MKRTAGFLTTCAIAALNSSASFGAVTLLDDRFNDGALGSNPDTGGGFDFLDNGSNPGTGPVSESGSQARILDGTGTNTSGILSSNAFDLSGTSRSGNLYQLASSEDLLTAISTWPPYFDGVTTDEKIAPSGTGTNTLLNVIPLGPRRFFAVIDE